MILLFNIINFGFVPMKINVDILMLVLFVKLFSLPQLRVWRCDTLWHFVTAADRWRMVWRQQNSQRLPSDTSMAPGLRSPSQPTAHCFPKIFSFQIFFVPRTGSAADLLNIQISGVFASSADRLVIWAVLTFAIICPFYHPDIWHWIWNQNYLVLCRSGCWLWVWEPRRWSQWLEIWIDQLECLPFTGHRWSRAGHWTADTFFWPFLCWRAGAGWATLTPPSSRGPNLSFLSASIALGMLEKPLCLSMPRIFIA